MNDFLLKEYNINPEKILHRISTYLENEQYKAYSSVSGLCNPVVSKNPFTSNFTIYYLRNKKIYFPIVLLIFSSIKFLINNSITLLLECLKILIISKNLKVDPVSKPILISFFNFQKMNESLFDELYFPSVQRSLIEKGVAYTYFPKLYHFPKGPFKTMKAIRKIKAKNSSFVSIYEITPRLQIFQLIYLSFAHYFQSLRTLKPFSSNLIDQAYNKSLIESLRSSEANKFLQYVATKEFLKRRSTNKIILWYENQAIDKCIIKAIRNSNPKIVIYGCQFFLVTPQEQNLFPSKFEIETNLIPDKIFIMQDPPLDSTIPEKYFLGKGLRYLYIHKYKLSNLPEGKSGNYSVFLTIFREKNERTLDLLNEANLENASILIKKHPVLINDPLPPLKNAEISSLSQEELLLNSELIFATDTGLIYEAIAMNRQVIILGSDNLINQFIPPAEYQGKFWIRVTSSTELINAISTLKEARRENPEELKTLSQKARSTFFKNSEQPILDIFEL